MGATAYLGLLVLVSSEAAKAAGPRLILELPEGMAVRSATATAQQLKLQIKGVAENRSIAFSNLLPDTRYDVAVVLADGRVLQGADMAWYTDEAPAGDVQPMDDDDRQQLKELFDGIKAFEETGRKVLLLRGDHQRATMLAEIIRDSGFHGDKGGEIIWRVELWYFKNQHGGWERVAQASKVLRRERFRNKAEFDRQAGRTLWLAELGGIRITRDEPKKIVRVSVPDN